MSEVLPRDKVWASGLAAGVHLLLLLVLIFSVSWKHLPNNPVYAELWSNLPGKASSAPAKVVEAPAPKPEPVAKPEPRPEPVEPPAPKETVAKPDIALEAAKKREAKKKAEEEKRLQLAQEMKKAEQQKLAQDAKLAQQRAAEAAAAQQQKAQEAARKKLDAMIAAQMSQDINQEKQSIQQQAAAAARSKVVDDYVSRIQQKIRGLIRLPPTLKGNPEAVYKVDLLPNGEVLNVTQVRSSRQPAYDQEVERAIWKASPLPLPSDRDAAAAFRNGLNLSFKPHDS